MRIGKVLVINVLAIALMACAQPGYHFEGGSFTPVPNDPCQHVALASKGATEWLNTSAGAPEGVPAQVTAIEDSRSPDFIRLASIRYTFPSDDKSMICHVTLTLASGALATGVVTISNPGAHAPLQVKWLPDEMISARLAKIDGLTSGKKLFVVPDLENPEIQRCVGRETALGLGEEFPGQAWAVCKAKLENAKK